MTEGQMITSETLIPIGVAVAIALFAVGAAWRVSALLARIDARLASIDRTMGGHWTLKDHLGWAMELKDRNPDLNVPRPVAGEPEAT